MPKHLAPQTLARSNKKLHNLFPMSVHNLLVKRDYRRSSLLHFGFRYALNYRQHLKKLHQCEQHPKTTPLKHAK